MKADLRMNGKLMSAIWSAIAAWELSGTSTCLIVPPELADEVNEIIAREGGNTQEVYANRPPEASNA